MTRYKMFTSANTAHAHQSTSGPWCRNTVRPSCRVFHSLRGAPSALPGGACGGCADDTGSTLQTAVLGESLKVTAGFLLYALPGQAAAASSGQRPGYLVPALGIALDTFRRHRAASHGGERGRGHQPHPECDRALVHVKDGLVNVEVLSRSWRPGPEPGEGAGNGVQVPGEVLAAETLARGSDGIRPENPVGCGLEHSRAQRVVDGRW